MNESTYNYSAKRVVELINDKKSRYWERLRERKMLEWFRAAAKRVPAYRDFLKKNGINAVKVKTIGDFQKVPPVSKKNYLNKYELCELCWDGVLEKPFVYTATSGSTGEPVYFVRGQRLDWQYSVILERFLRARMGERDGATLVIVCFGMGLWIGGVITYKGFELAAQRNNFPVSVITPGLNKKEIFNALKKLSPKYKYTVLAGYPPFIKDIIDEAPLKKINVGKLNLRLLFAAEAITEGFRDYVVENGKIRDGYRDTMSIYGSADIGAMAEESAAGILIRRLTNENRGLFNDIFSLINKTPTLAQYNPLFINFEERDGELLLTGDSAIPLIRYAIGDNGGVFSFGEAEEKLGKYGISFRGEIVRAKVGDMVAELPFVFVYERKDMSTTFYGLLIYPEWIRGALLEKPISEYLTGKFTLVTKYDKRRDQYLELNLELKEGKSTSEGLKKRVLERVVEHMRKNSSEFTEITNQMKERANPRLVFWPKDHPKYFAMGIKQRWTERN